MNAMFRNLWWKMLAFVVAGLFTLHLLQDLYAPRTAYAQQFGSGYPVYIEPGVSMLRAPDGTRQVLGKVVVDLTNGNVWGFPTTVEQNYPVDPNRSDPPVSKPFLLGKFDFSRMAAGR